MAKGIREFKKITEAPAGGAVTERTLFEGVVDKPDDEGLVARQVSGLDIENFAAREGGKVDEQLIEGALDNETGRYSGKAFGYTDKERDRARAAEGDLESLEGADKTSLVAALNGERSERLAEASGLDRRKADKIIKSKALSAARNGESLGEVTFWRQGVPEAAGADGTLELSSGAYFTMDAAAGEFSYTTGMGVKTVVYQGGAWLRDSVDTGGAAVVRTVNIEGSVWEYARFGGVDAGLEEVNRTAVDALKKAGDALQAAATVATGLETEKKERASDVDVLSARIDDESAARKKADTAVTKQLEKLIDDEAAARAAAITANGAQLEKLINDEAAAREHQDDALNARIDALPEVPPLPGADGEYKLVVSGGAVYWEII